MPKIFNVVASMFVFFLASAGVYMFWNVVNTWIGEISDTILRNMLAFGWFSICFMAIFVAPIIILVQEDLKLTK